jgi:hypothetical protein
MTQPLDLDQIEARAAHLYEYVQQPEEADVLAGTDVPAMADEIRRLCARVAELEEERRLEWLAQGTTPHTPRLCACGHSHHAHRVPAPHSCFAHGQTCPCEAYQQLPHDEAVAQLERNRQAAAERAAARP